MYLLIQLLVIEISFYRCCLIQNSRGHNCSLQNSHISGWYIFSLFKWCISPQIQIWVCYVKVCSISVDFTLILLLRTSKYSEGWINFESESKIKLIVEQQFHGLGLKGCGMVGTPPQLGLSMRYVTDANTVLLLRELKWD